MKPLRLTLFLTVLLLLAPGTAVHASQRIPDAEARAALAAKIGARYGVRFEPDARNSALGQRKIDKIIRKLSRRAAIDFSDPVDKWMWFWLLSWAAGLVLGVIGLGWFGWVLFVAGTVFLIIWLIRRSEK